MSARRVILALATTQLGLAAGFFYTYQISVTRALAEVDDTTYVATFRAINETVRNGWFGVVFFGSVPVLAAATIAHWTGPRPVRALVTLGLALQVAVIAITASGNVPLNDDLAAHTQLLTEDESRQARHAFETDWNRLNLLRALASTAAFGSLVAATSLAGDHHQRRDAPATAAREIVA